MARSEPRCSQPLRFRGCTSAGPSRNPATTIVQADDPGPFRIQVVVEHDSVFVEQLQIVSRDGQRQIGDERGRRRIDDGGGPLAAHRHQDEPTALHRRPKVRPGFSDLDRRTAQFTGTVGEDDGPGLGDDDKGVFGFCRAQQLQLIAGSRRQLAFPTVPAPVRGQPSETLARLAEFRNRRRPATSINRAAGSAPV